MNLKALFNKNYFKENIRKSRGLLAFLLGIIPIVNILYLTVILTIEESILLDFNLLSFITYVGLFFIPLALSLNFFGFVFKKKSVDFIMSKPISRKSIFTTSTLGGILIILIFMLLNTLIFGLFSLIFESLTIPFALLFDYFLFWLISYIFIFIVINLAIILSGNLVTSFVVLALILFTVPYINFVNIFTSNNDYYLTCEEEECMPSTYFCYGDTECEEHLLNHEYNIYAEKETGYNFIAPLSGFNNDTTFYNTTSLLKMFFLSIGYAVIGFIAFKKRKMENNEMSFKSNKTHYFVKGLTLIPVCLITYAILQETGILGWIIVIFGIIIYSIIYDLIVRKEIYKPVKSSLISLALFLLFTGIYELNFDVFDHNNQIIKKVDSIVYNDITITDKELINELIASLLGKDANGDYYAYTFLLVSDKEEYKVTIGICNNLMELLNDEVESQNQEKLANFNWNQIDYLSYNNISIPLNKTIKTLIKENAGEINNFTLNELLENERLYIYTYQNHHYETQIIPIKINKELYEEVITYQNEEFIKQEEKKDYDSYYHLEYDPSGLFTDFDSYIFSYVITSNKTDFLNYLKTENSIDMSKDSMVVTTYRNKLTNVTISDVATFKEEFDTYKEKVKDTDEYQLLEAEYQSMQENGVYE